MFFVLNGLHVCDADRQRNCVNLAMSFDDLPQSPEDAWASPWAISVLLLGPVAALRTQEGEQRPLKLW